MTVRPLVRGLMAALLLVAPLASGCWSRSQGEAYVLPAFEEQGLGRLAVLPVVNQTDWTLATDAVTIALTNVLTKEKKYDVAPRTMVTSTLSRGGGASHWARLIERQTMGEAPTDDALARICHDLGADGLVGVTVESFHQAIEEKPATSPQGEIYYRAFPVTIITLKAWLWGSRAKTIVWRDAHTERYFHEPGAEGRGEPLRIAEIAARELLSRLPTNTWRAPTRPATP